MYEAKCFYCNLSPLYQIVEKWSGIYSSTFKEAHKNVLGINPSKNICLKIKNLFWATLKGKDLSKNRNNKNFCFVL